MAPTSQTAPIKKCVVSWTKTITTYIESGNIDKASQLFVKMPLPNQSSWNIILTSLLHSNRLQTARNLFRKMPYKNPASYAAMISGLSRSGFVSEAREVFESSKVSGGYVVCWTAMISCYSRNGLYFDALRLFVDCYGYFFELDVMPNSYTFSVVLKCCLEVRSLVLAMQIRGLIERLLNVDDEKCVYVHNALIDLYSKLGKLADAENVFNGMKCKDLSSWNIMMSAYTRHLNMNKAVGIFNSMQEKDTLSWNILISGFSETSRKLEALESFISIWNLQVHDTRPNPSTFTIVLTLCATFCMLDWGTLVHGCTIKYGLYKNNVFIDNSLITMYARIGFIEKSERVFNEMQQRDVISWNSLVFGLGQNGYCARALEAGEKAIELGRYNHITFIGLLTSCSHGDLVDEGLKYFRSMGEKYGIEPSLDHYICVIDMVGRSGRISEACNLLHNMPFEPNSVIWETLLSACVLHGNVEVGELAAQKLKELEPNNVNSYVMLANLYGRNGRSDDYKRIMSLMNDAGLEKKQCHSSIL